MGDILDRVTKTMGEVIARIDTPFVTYMRMGGVFYTIDHRVSHGRVLRSEVYL
jgi:hypothetical protein